MSRCGAAAAAAAAGQPPPRLMMSMMMLPLLLAGTAAAGRTITLSQYDQGGAEVNGTLFPHLLKAFLNNTKNKAIID